MADDRQRFSWAVLTGDGLLLLCALLGFTGSFLSLYGDPDSRATVLDRCASKGELLLLCAALFGLATLCVWSLPRFRGAAAGWLTALWAVGIFWNRTEVVHGAGVTAREITVLFARRVPWGQVFSYESGLRPAQEANSALIFFLLTLAGLALALGWIVVRSRRWWLVALLTLPPLLPGLLADLYPDWLSFMALAACWCAMLLTSLCRRSAPDRRGALTLTALSSAALTLALITVLFPLKGYTRPAWTRKAQDGLLNFTNRLSDYLPRWDDGPFKTTVTYVGAAEEVDLAHAGPLNYTGRMVLRVTSDRGGWTYLRGSSLAVYENGIWKPLPDGTYEGYWSGQEPEVSPLYLPAMQEQVSGRVHTITVDNIGAVGTCVYAPYFLLPQDPAETGMLPVEDAYWARKQGQWTNTMTFVDLQIFSNDSLSPGSSLSPGGGSGGEVLFGTDAPNPAQSAASAYAAYVYDNYLDVPENLREFLEPYARFAITHQALYGRSGHDGSIDSIWLWPGQMAELFGAYLDDICQYDDSAPAAPDGVDPVYYFLNESHRGYCMHYASAVTLMLRTMGIPARYVSGFAAEVPTNRQVGIPDQAAHAWVEVWLDGFGWYPVEVTPAAAFDWARRPDSLETDSPVNDTPEPTPGPTATPEPTVGPTDAPDQPTGSLPGGGGDLDGPGQIGPTLDFTALFNLLKDAAPVIGALLTVWSIQFIFKRFRAWRMAGSNANRSALICYSYLCRLERWGGRMDTQAVELAQKARFSQHTLTREELGLLRYLVDRERSRLCVVPSLTMRLAFRYWWGRPRPPVPPGKWTPQQQ